MSFEKLNVGDFGAEVAMLQANLKKHGFKVSVEEEKRQFFGPTTREAVGEFQKAHGIDPSCEVCKQTAALLENQSSVANIVDAVSHADNVNSSHQISSESGLVEQPVLNSPSVIKRPLKLIIPPLDRSDHGADVVNLQEALLLLLEQQIIKLSDQYFPLLYQGQKNEQISQIYNDYTEKLIGIFQEQFSTKFHLSVNGEVDLPTADALNHLLTELGALPSGQNEEETFTVDGKVQSVSRAGVNRLRVVIVDKNIGGDVPLAETVTGKDGFYHSKFLIQGLQERCKQRPDLQSRVFKDETTYLGASDVRYNATNYETLNIVLDEQASSALASEHETLTSELTDNCHVSLKDLKETEDQQDITYLANKTGWDARAVALAALADQFSARTLDERDSPTIEPAFFYALFRAGLPANEDALYQTDANTAAAIWTQAIKQGVIPIALENSIPQTLDRFRSLATLRVLDAPALTGLSSLKEMLSVSLGEDPDPKRQREKELQFADIFTQHRTEPDKLWDAVRNKFGETVEGRLRLDGQLSYLTLNNAPLIRKLHERAGSSGLTNALDLVDQGFYRADKWKEVIDGGDIPPDIGGADDAEKRVNYHELMAAQVRLSFPTAVVAEVIKGIETPTANLNLAHKFLRDHYGKFEIGIQPIEQYIMRNNLQVTEDVTQALKQVQRVYQITPSDGAMTALLKKGIDSAYAVVQYDRDKFIQLFKDELGGEVDAQLVYTKSQQVHNAVLNIATSYMIAKNAPPIGVHSPPKIIDQAPKVPANTGDVIAYSTLESLFGEMDYCACEHCRSIFSPAAYLVNLLQFIDLRRYNDQGVELPTSYDGENPLDVLLERRPDIQHLPLTCENTNTPLPYIDLVNETLEYFVFNQLSLKHYEGHDTNGDATPEELLASPQFGDTKISEKVYETLASAYFPPPLPFQQPLENLRRYFDRFEAPLPEVMEVLRENDSLERKNVNDYGWRDILMEELRLSRAEYALLSDRTLTLQQLYGYPATISESEILGGRLLFSIGMNFVQELNAGEISQNLCEQFEQNGRALSDKSRVEVKKPESNWTLVDAFMYDIRNENQALNIYIIGLSNAKAFARRMGISYEDIIEILRTRFINPHSTLIPKLERLGIPFAALKTLKDSPLTGQAWLDLLPKPLPDAAQYGGNIEAWVKNDAHYGNIMSLIILADPTGKSDVCSFNKLEFRYSDPDKINEPIRTFEFYRLIRFIRLWKKLGWGIEQTDKAITALYPVSQTPNHADDAVNLQRLDDGFLILLPRLGVIKRVMQALKLNVKKDLLSLLACFAPLDTYGAISFYRQLFLSPVLLKQDDVFAEDGYGNFLKDDAQKLFAHVEALRAAFQLTEDEFALITADLRYDANTSLEYTPTDEEITQLLGHAPNDIERNNLKQYWRTQTISEVFRRGWLARKLKLSVSELLLLTRFTGFDPFAAPDAQNPPILRLIELVNGLRAASLKPVQALYLIWNQDISGKSAPDDSEVLEFGRSLRAGFSAIESEFIVVNDPDGQIARTKMALVYDNDITDRFFGLLDEKTVTDAYCDDIDEDTLGHALDAGIGYDLRLMSVAKADDLPNNGDKLIIVALVGTDLHIRIFDSNNKVVDKAENELVSGEALAALKNRLTPIPDVSILSNKEKLKIIEDATSIAGYTLKSKISYDNLRKRLSYTGGVLPDAIRDALNSVPGVSQAFKDAVDELHKKSRSFFDRFPELEELYDAYVTSNDTPEKKRSNLLKKLLGTLKPRRKQQQALQAISAAWKTDIGFASALLDNKLDDKYVLHATKDANQPALNDLTALELPGLSAEFFFRNTATGKVDHSRDAEANLNYSSAEKDNAKLSDNGGNAISGIWSGYLETPENGFYNFHIEADTGAKVTLTLGGTKIDLKPVGNRYSNEDPIELKAGTLYPISLKVEKVKGTLTVCWETEGRGKELIPARQLYSATLISRLRATYIRFLKAISLTETLKLTANEAVHFAWHADYRFAGQGYLNSLPVTGSPNKDMSTALRKAFMALLDYARIKKELSPEDERLLTVLKDPEVTIQKHTSETDKPELLLFSLTRWEPDSLDALLIRFGKVKAGKADRSALKDLDTFKRVHTAYGALRKLGVAAPTLIKATTNEPNAVIVRNLQSALRARYEPTDWLNVLRPINDEMRGLQRDALVTYILHQMRVNPESAHINTPEKLFEYFLMDVQMAPCMQTSRIRHALSSIQLFIERCLMNLEPRIKSSSLSNKAEQWEWMKRYRVYEANLKVYCWTENWLEPELRDDQSPFFREAMSELLQGDITEDRAATALLNYLSKLDEVAKLEPCGIHYAENDLTKGEDDIVHVVARSTGTKRKYYYRRREYSYWTPWEEIKLDIEDNPVIPVVWKGRLFLFWLRIKQAQSAPQKPPESNKDDNLASLPVSVLTANKITPPVEAILCWSEYYNGKWQPANTSDVNKAALLGNFAIDDFDRSKLTLSAYEESNALRIYISGEGASSFLLYNTHSLPTREQEAGIGPVGFIYFPQNYVLDMSEDTLTIAYKKEHSALEMLGVYNSGQVPLSRIVMKMPEKNASGRHAIKPRHGLKNPWDAPFFYGDKDHVFYVSTQKSPVTVSEWNWSFPTVVTPSKPGFTIPPFVFEPNWTIPNPQDPVITGPYLGIVNSAPIQRLVTEDAYVKKAISTTGTVRFEGVDISAVGNRKSFK